MALTAHSSWSHITHVASAVQGSASASGVPPVYHTTGLCTVHRWISIASRLWLLSRQLYAHPLPFAAGLFGVAVGGLSALAFVQQGLHVGTAALAVSGDVDMCLGMGLQVASAGVVRCMQRRHGCCRTVGNAECSLLVVCDRHSNVYKLLAMQAGVVCCLLHSLAAATRMCIKLGLQQAISFSRV